MREPGLWLGCLLLALACSKGPDPGSPLQPTEAETASASSVAEPTPASPFDLARLGGGRVRLEDYRGKYLLLDFWATWCPPCILEIPELNAFYDRFRGQGVEVLAIDIDAPEVKDLAGFVRDRKMEYPIALGDDEVARAYRAMAFPFHVLVGPEGHVLERLTPGFHDREELAELVGRHRS
ncbi:MAG: TlpA family protein disulfide reductase [Myxococcota bacterium]